MSGDLASKKCCTNNSSVVSKLGTADFCLFFGVDGENLGFHIFTQGRKKRLALVGNSAADTENIRLERIDDVGNPAAQIGYVGCLLYTSQHQIGI